MRIFVGQENIIETDPAIDETTGDVLDTLDVRFNLYDSDDVLVPSSNIVLGYAGAGVYMGTCPLLSIVDQQQCKAEMIMRAGSAILWYFKGPCKAIIRKYFHGS